MFTLIKMGIPKSRYRPTIIKKEPQLENMSIKKVIKERAAKAWLKKPTVLT
jgi:hypothetical protein